jgi:hypothetical protein
MIEYTPKDMGNKSISKKKEDKDKLIRHLQNLLKLI